MKNYTEPIAYDGDVIAGAKKAQKEEAAMFNDKSPSDSEIENSIEYHKGTLKRLSE